MKHLDTNIVIAALKGDPRVEGPWLAAMPEIAISSVA